jgi:hypothetical protein
MKVVREDERGSSGWYDTGCLEDSGLPLWYDGEQSSRTILFGDQGGNKQCVHLELLPASSQRLCVSVEQWGSTTRSQWKKGFKRWARERAARIAAMGPSGRGTGLLGWTSLGHFGGSRSISQLGLGVITPRYPLFLVLSFFC